MSTIDCLIDTNILIYHTKGSQVTIDFLSDMMSHHSLNISILTKIEFLGWDKHTLKVCNLACQPDSLIVRYPETSC